MTQPKTVPSINATANGLYSDKKNKTFFNNTNMFSKKNI